MAPASGVFGHIRKECPAPEFLKLCFSSYLEQQVTLFGQLFNCLQPFTSILSGGR